MKKIFLAVLLLLNVYIGFSQAEIRNDGAVHATGNFPVALSSEIKGSPKRVKDTLERNAILMNFRDTGMFCYVTSLKKTYQLQDGIANTNWIEYKSGGGTTYKPGTAIVIGADSSLNADTTNTLLSKVNAVNNYVPKVRKINNKPLTGDITIDKTDINLSVVDNTSDINKPVSAPQQVVFDTKVDNDTLQDFNPVLDFSKSRRERVYNQTGIINLSLAANVKHKIGRSIFMKINATYDSINVPSNWINLAKIQPNHLNILRIDYTQDGDIVVTNNVVDRNNSNIIVLDSGATSAVTYEKFYLPKIVIYTPFTINNFSIGTTQGGTDILDVEQILPGETIIDMNAKFDLNTRIYFNNINSQTVITIYTGGYND
jgi:hypothetical protein